MCAVDLVMGMLPRLAGLWRRGLSGSDKLRRCAFQLGVRSSNEPLQQVRVRRCNRSWAGPLLTSTSIQSRVPPLGPAKVFAAQLGCDYIFLFVHAAACSDECAMGKDYDNACPTGALCSHLAGEERLVEHLRRLGRFGRWVLQIQRATNQRVTRPNPSKNSCLRCVLRSCSSTYKFDDMDNVQMQILGSRLCVCF